MADQDPKYQASRRESGVFEYQSFKLKKVIEMVPRNKKSVPSLKSVHGLEPLKPSGVTRGIILNNLFAPQGEYDEDGNQMTNCQVLIVVAMYNESAKQFTDTMQGINENLAYFEKAGIPSDQIAVVVIIDGIEPFMKVLKNDPDFFGDYFDERTVLDAFDAPSLDKCTYDGLDPKIDEFAHCFSQYRTFGRCSIPLQVIFCVKHFNRRKLNTHLWFFGGFCNEIQPLYVILLDVGTKPLAGSLFYMYEAMVLDNDLAGCCGEIRPMSVKCGNLVVPAQTVEYKFSHMFDKALESVIGFITVLPGAFSAYRWDALSLGTSDDPESLEGSPL